ncbi:MFS transporter [Simiduia litorea]|uniref:MFS transporter n=1 Tax=Simiduia litorea TaxID=1435348 RepID=UPI0036F427C5
MPKKNRYAVLALVFVSVVINYMDRTNISVASAALTEELALSSLQMGLIFSAFGWTYSLLQIPGGIAVDLIKIRLLYPIILFAWSLVTLLQGFISSFAGLIGARMAIGVFEAPSYPCNNKIVTDWFEPQERASAIAIYTSGQFIGLAFLMPLLTLIQGQFGWRGLFIISGIVGIVWATVWYLLYRDPEAAPTAKTEHLAPRKFHPTDIVAVFKQPKLIGIFIGQFCLGGTLIFFLTWFPTYLVEYRGLDFIKSGFLASLPFLAAFVGVLVAGFLSDFLVRRHFSEEVARKAPVIIGLLLSTTIVGANFTDDTFWVITFLSLAFFGNGLASIAWVFVSLLAPKHLVGLVGGCFNFVGGLSAVVVPVVIGVLVSDGDFRPALFFIALLALTGCTSYLFLVGKIHTVEINTTPNSKHPNTNSSLT